MPPRRSRVLCSASHSPAVSPRRSETSASNEVPAREDKPVPSALTSTVFALQRPITFKVNLLSGGMRDATSRSSLLRPTFQLSGERRPRVLPKNRRLNAAVLGRGQADLHAGERDPRGVWEVTMNYS